MQVEIGVSRIHSHSQAPRPQAPATTVPQAVPQESESPQATPNPPCSMRDLESLCRWK